ncbi:MAG TPA: choice-of-anchor M domain-containing protein [Arachnia sp.]|nr:choice-of-anchor M domain-containing protein [Arachnia sp.]
MKRLATLLLAVVLALGLSLSVLPARGAPSVTALDQGHVDAFYVTSDGEGGIDLRLREDVTGSGVVHEPEDVVLRVKQEALIDIPEGFPGSPRAYYLPLTQNPDLLWPGWETTPARDAGVGKVEFEIGVDGPGEVHLWSTGSLGDVVSLLADGGTGLPGTIVAPFPAHTHANWAFTQPGTYTFTVRADGHVGDGVLSSPTRTYTWEVGDPAEPTPTPTATEEPTEEPTSEPTEEPTPEPTPTTEPPASPQPTTSPTVRPTTKPTPPASRRPTPSATPSAGAGITPSASPSAARVECRPVTVTTKGTGSADGR